MSNEVKWRFAGNNNTTINGINNANIQIFMKNPLMSLAREMTQNSIDAKNVDVDAPVIVEFKSFKIKTSQMPWYKDLVSEIENCENYWGSETESGIVIRKMKELTSKEYLTCLRVSDFNTKGLIGVSDFNNKNTPWYYLIHGSGVSEKTSSGSGGSKGIGKFAAVVNSLFRTVFYSTVSKEDEIGYEGIANLCSAKMKNSTNNELTVGVGYYGIENNNPIITEQISIDPNFKREKGEFGTDAYIIAFNDETNWEKTIITNVIESFIVAILNNKLIVRVADIEISKETLSSIIYDNKYIDSKRKKNIISQYLLLTEEDVIKESFEVIHDGIKLGDVKLYLKAFESSEENYSTYSCTMVRYPYMKILDEKITNIDCSAMCIIEKNNISSMLRDVENVEHTEWQFNRINNIDVRQTSKYIYQKLVLGKIKEIVFEHLSSSNADSTDAKGIGQHLGKIGKDGVGIEGKTGAKSNKAKLEKKVKQETLELNAKYESNTPTGALLDLFINGGDSPVMPEHGDGKRKGENIKTGNSGGEPSDDGVVGLTKNTLKGMNYRFFCVNRKMSKYVISFVSPEHLTSAKMEIKKIDAQGSKTDLKILSASINGKEIEIEENSTISLGEINKEKIFVEIETGEKNLFSVEVVVYENR